MSQFAYRDINAFCLRVVPGLGKTQFTNLCWGLCIILTVTGADRSILFTGDLGVEGGRKALAGPYADRLHADYVQMAHHGQNGVEEAFYQHVDASVCLWPTPIWLWNNDAGSGKGSGPWKTLEVRAWMEKLPIKRHYVTCLDGELIE